MINTLDGFTKTANVADGFSDLILTLYDREVGAHARSAVGVQDLPLNLPVVVDAIVDIMHEGYSGESVSQSVTLRQAVV
jgi:hypothetical protein